MSAAEHAVGWIGKVTRDLKHHGLMGMRRAADDVDSPRVQFNRKHHEAGDQSSNGPDFCRDEIRGNQRFPAPAGTPATMSSARRSEGSPPFLRIVAMVDRATR